MKLVNLEKSLYLCNVIQTDIIFRKTETNPQLDLFTAPSTILPKRAQKKYTDEKAWHNQFFKLVTSRIDEEAFMPLFEETNMGAPNASIRILVAMSILKEGFGCSDEALFEKCEFDLLARKALGLEMLDDKLPSLDTYYLFGRRLTDYEQRTGVNLMERCFEQVTGEQIKLFRISGNSVRMDSKLIGSNIAQYSRYELIHRTLCKVLRDECVIMMLNPKLRKGAEVGLGEDSGKTVYRSNKDEMAQRLVKIGLYIYAVLKRLRDDAPVSLLTASSLSGNMLLAILQNIVRHIGHTTGLSRRESLNVRYSHFFLQKRMNNLFLSLYSGHCLIKCG